MSDVEQKSDPFTSERESPLAQDYTPMPMANESAAPEPDTFKSDTEGLRSAATELQERRQEKAPVLERGYIDHETRERRPMNETRKLSEAADDLKAVRARERGMTEEWDNSSLRERIDQFRAEQDAQEALAGLAARKEAAAAREAALQSQPELQPEPQPVPEPQPEARPEPTAADGVHPEVRAALQNPHIRDAMAAIVQQSENARLYYNSVAQQAAQLAQANFYSQFPEIAGVSQEAFPQVLNAIAQRDPQRAAAIRDHIRNTQDHLRQIQQVQLQHQQAAQQQAHQQQQRAQQDQARAFQQHAAVSDTEYDSYVATRPAHEKELVRRI